MAHHLPCCPIAVVLDVCGRSFHAWLLWSAWFPSPTHRTIYAINKYLSTLATSSNKNKAMWHTHCRAQLFQICNERENTLPHRMLRPTFCNPNLSMIACAFLFRLSATSLPLCWGGGEPCSHVCCHELGACGHTFFELSDNPVCFWMNAFNFSSPSLDKASSFVDNVLMSGPKRPAHSSRWPS